MKKTSISYNKKKMANERKLIFEMIDASCELAARKGAHPMENGCNCIACVNKRKRLLEPHVKKWKFRL